MSNMTDNSEFLVDDDDVTILTRGEYQRRQSTMLSLRRLLVRSWRDDDGNQQTRYTTGSGKHAICDVLEVGGVASAVILSTATKTAWVPVAFRFYNDAEASILAVQDAHGITHRIKNEIPDFEMIDGFDMTSIKAQVATKSAVTSIYVPSGKNLQRSDWHVEVLLFKKQEWMVDRKFQGVRPAHGGKPIEMDPNSRLQTNLF